jgi:hypothetical protein
MIGTPAGVRQLARLRRLICAGCPEFKGRASMKIFAAVEP